MLLRQKPQGIVNGLRLTGKIRSQGKRMRKNACENAVCGHDFYTDIVTFPLTDSGDVISSEFCISLDRIAENSLNFGRSFESELLRVIIHGVLHLIGYDDHTDEERSRMREKEEECLRQFYK